MYVQELYKSYHTSDVDCRAAESSDQCRARVQLQVPVMRVATRDSCALRSETVSVRSHGVSDKT